MFINIEKMPRSYRVAKDFEDPVVPNLPHFFCNWDYPEDNNLGWWVQCDHQECLPRRFSDKELKDFLDETKYRLRDPNLPDEPSNRHYYILSRFIVLCRYYGKDKIFFRTLAMCNNDMQKNFMILIYYDHIRLDITEQKTGERLIEFYKGVYKIVGKNFISEHFKNYRDLQLGVSMAEKIIKLEERVKDLEVMVLNKHTSISSDIIENEIRKFL